MSSPSGGFYKYRCKYFLPNDCKNWVWVQGEACPVCMAEGRDSQANYAMPWTPSQDIIFPHVRDGILQYAFLEVEPVQGNVILRAKDPRFASEMSGIARPSFIIGNMH